MPLVIQLGGLSRRRGLDHLYKVSKQSAEVLDDSHEQGMIIMLLRSVVQGQNGNPACIIKHTGIHITCTKF